MNENTPLLDRVRTPEELRRLPEADLRRLADELRSETISAVSVTGGHLGAGLGVVELTVALHYVFNTPADRIIWDVGHQAYPHKILTGRRDRIRTLRQGGGLSGFTKRAESEYDPFGAAHSSTSISAGLGMAVARDLAGGDNSVVAVIGDGSMSAGMAYEAMNNAGALKSRLVVILNDNNMSIAPPVGGMSAHLARLVSGGTYRSLRDFGKQLAQHLPRFFYEKAKRTEEYARGFFTGGTLFEELGFYYVGPIDGHNLDHLLPVLKNVRDSEAGPILVHVVTRKGHGYAPAEASADKYHGVNKFDVITGAQVKPKANAPAYTRVFADSLVKEAEKDDKIVAITAAMPSGTGLDVFGKRFPKRTFDVGIAEQHAVTFAAGLATEGYKPFCTIYSTFLQRGYDQVVHDVALQNLPVRFALDRAGLVGADGPTHAGSFDVAYLGCLPNMMIMAAADEAELVHMVATQVAYNDGPSALRYPRGEGIGMDMPEFGVPLEIGKGRIVREGKQVAIFSFGTRLQESLKAAETLASHGLSTTVADARFAKPLDRDLLRQLAQTHEVLLTIEEGSVGGFGSYVLHALSEDGLLDRGLKVRSLVLPDTYIDHEKPEVMYAQAGLDAQAIVTKVMEVLGIEEALPNRPKAVKRLQGEDGLRPERGDNRTQETGLSRRLDQRLAADGFFESRAKAREAIDAGLVKIDGRTVRKPALLVRDEARIEAGAPYPWVSRGGVKLAAGLDAFGIDPRRRTCLDVGASTGGFTDVLLSRGAALVYAVDVGHDQLHPRLRGDARVTDWSGRDIRRLDAAVLVEPPTLLVCDVSFISLTLVLPPVFALAAASAELVALIKPQFEAGQGGTDRGIVRDEATRAASCRRVAAVIETEGWTVVGLQPSPIAGGDGNQEFLIGARR